MPIHRYRPCKNAPAYELLYTAITYAERKGSHRIFFFKIDRHYWEWSLHEEGMGGREPTFI